MVRVFPTVFMRGDGSWEVVIGTPEFDAPYDIVIYVCRICEIHTGPVEFRIGERIPPIDHVRCPKGHLLTLPSVVIMRDIHDATRWRRPVPVEREKISAGSLDLDTGLRLYASAQAVLDRKASAESLSQALDASPDPIRNLKPKKMTFERWMTVAALVVALIGPMLPTLLEHGSVDEQTIVIRLEQTEAPGNGPDEGVDGGEDAPAPEDEVYPVLPDHDRRAIVAGVADDGAQPAGGESEHSDGEQQQ